MLLWLVIVPNMYKEVFPIDISECCLCWKPFKYFRLRKYSSWIKTKQAIIESNKQIQTYKFQILKCKNFKAVKEL